MRIKAIFIFGFVIAVSQRSFVDTAPTTDIDKDNPEAKADDNVAELENLKHSLGRTLSMMNTQTGLFSDIDGKKESHSTKTQEVKQDRQLIAKLFQRMDTDSEAPDKGVQPRTRVRTEIDVPSAGIHKSIVQQLPADYSGPLENNNQEPNSLNSPQESRNTLDLYNSIFDKIQQYEPLDMAEYVFWTGDERSVSLAIEDFLQRGLMSREEAILFLQQIKYNLDYLKSHYNQYELGSRGLSATVKGKTQVDNNQITLKPDLPHDKTDIKQIRNDLNELRQLQEAHQKRNRDETAASYLPESNLEKNQGVDRKTIPYDGHDELIERLRLADFLYTEYSLEEVIYQLAKMIFAQSLAGGSAEAQNALTKFINFLEKEADAGRISRSLEKKVLDVLIASLLDTVSEHPKLLAMRRGSLQNNENIATQQLLRQILELSSEDKALLKNTINSNFDYPKGQIDGNNQINNNFQMKE